MSEDFINFRNCEELRAKCRVSFRVILLSLSGVVIPLLITLVVFSFQTSRAQSERDARQEERIVKNEQNIDRNYGLLREDLKEIKTLLRHAGGQ